MKNLKYLIFGILILISTANIFGQLATRYPTDVRYIGGGYIDKRPQFSTLEAALNDVIDYATVNRPYVFWVASDTVNIADWDSVFTESGLTMKDSIDVYYVAEGKIKWAGFGFGGNSGSGGTAAIPSQTQTTTHYSYPNWDQANSALSLWIRNLARGIDSVDQHIWDLIVWTDSVYLYIENDTLKFRANVISSITHTRPDTTIIAYKTINQTISGDWTVNGDMAIGTGSFRLPTSNNNTGVSRILWSSSNRPYYSGSGVAGDTVKLASINLDTGQLEDNNVVGWLNLDDATRDSIATGFTNTFSGTLTKDTVAVSGLTSSDIIIVGPMGGTYSVNDILFVAPGTNQFIVTRNSSGTSGLQYWWAWIRKQSL